jgi:hypothetical protein
MGVEALELFANKSEQNHAPSKGKEDKIIFVEIIHKDR